jgi:hypothetical protein
MVECDVAQRDVLFQLRRVGDPLPETLGQDQVVVGTGEKEDEPVTVG